MTTKDRVLHAVQDLPEDSSIEDVMERLLFMAKVERGIQQADAGKTITHDQVREKMAKWLR
jgi:predicted transcriptional regulator